MMSRYRRWNGLVAGGFGIACVLGGGACVDSALLEEAAGGLTVTTVPTPAHLVSGGNTLVRVELPPDVDAADAAAVTVSLDGTDVTSAFREAPADRLGRPGRAFLGLIEGIAEGDSTVRVSLGDAEAELTVTNYPITGPIFSGEHLEPYFCLGELAPGRDGAARRFAIGNGDVLLGEGQDENCSLDTRVDYVYRTTGPEATYAPMPNDGPLSV